jgi:hypothetical protein
MLQLKKMAADSKAAEQSPNTNEEYLLEIPMRDGVQSKVRVQYTGPLLPRAIPVLW